MLTKVLAAVIFVFFYSVLSVEAQSDTDKKEKVERKPDHNHQTFLKGGLVHAETDIKGFKIVVNGLSIDIETYFNKNHAGLSSWFIGYRKDDLKFVDSGHFINGGVSRIVATPMLDIRIGGGLEWGSASLDFSKTRFNYKDGDLKSYEQLFLKKNSNLPGVGPSGDAVLYPFFEIGLLKRWAQFMVELGMKGNIQRFGFDRYKITGDILRFDSSNDTVITPSVFIKFGLSAGKSRKTKKKES